MADGLDNQVIFVKVDTDDNPDLAREWEIQGIPAMIRIQNEKETGRLIGFRPESEIQQFIQG